MGEIISNDFSSFNLRLLLPCLCSISSQVAMHLSHASNCFLFLLGCPVYVSTPATRDSCWEQPQRWKLPRCSRRIQGSSNLDISLPNKGLEQGWQLPSQRIMTWVINAAIICAISNWKGTMAFHSSISDILCHRYLALAFGVRPSLSSRRITTWSQESLSASQCFKFYCIILSRRTVCSFFQTAFNFCLIAFMFLVLLLTCCYLLSAPEDGYNDMEIRSSFMFDP